VTVLKIHPEKIALPASSQLSCEIGPENAVLLLLNPLDREWPHQRRYLAHLRGFDAGFENFCAPSA